MTHRQIGAFGLAAVVLFGLGSALWALDQPAAGAPPRELLVFYSDGSDRIIAGGGISLLSIALFVVFASGVRRLLADADRDDVLATASFGGVLLGLSAGLGAETINMVAAARAGEGTLSPELARSLFETSYILGYNGAGVGLGLFALCVGAVALRTGAVLPRWAALATVAVGLGLFSPLVKLALLISVVAAAVICAKLALAPRGPEPGG